MVRALFFYNATLFFLLLFRYLFQSDLPAAASGLKSDINYSLSFFFFLLAPKISVAKSCINWEEQTAAQIIQLHRAIGSMVRVDFLTLFCPPAEDV